ncbi:hypothetical protein NIES267_51210 [Calothrix parasitica NIES-267]|uniref:Uncharacterized protein n=1 Tax=Calothrix parasitica NIES-267 TaxID=1973488 RepID=A0A1Z4LWP7_9CYAN|nr:hypothetical protein NIES267_51210 [Calothrix parasitica NIES-267]
MIYRIDVNLAVETAATQAKPIYMGLIIGMY